MIRRPGRQAILKNRRASPKDAKVNRQTCRNEIINSIRGTPKGEYTATSLARHLMRSGRITVFQSESIIRTILKEPKMAGVLSKAGIRLKKGTPNQGQVKGLRQEAINKMLALNQKGWPDIPKGQTINSLAKILLERNQGGYASQTSIMKLLQELYDSNKIRIP